MNGDLSQGEKLYEIKPPLGHIINRQIKLYNRKIQNILLSNTYLLQAPANWAKYLFNLIKPYQNDFFFN